MALPLKRIAIDSPNSWQTAIPMLVMFWAITAGIAAFLSEWWYAILLLGIPLTLAVIAFVKFPQTYKSSTVLEVSFDEHLMRVIPSQYSQRFLSEAPRQAPITADSKLIFTRKMSFGMGSGYSLALRSGNGPEQVLWEGFNADSTRLARELSSCGLSLKLITRDLDASGITESDWTPAPPPRISAAISVIAFVPMIGAALMRSVYSDPKMLSLTGLLLWIASELTLYLAQRRRGSNGRISKWFLLYRAYQFGVFYFVGVLLTGMFMTMK